MVSVSDVVVSLEYTTTPEKEPLDGAVRLTVEFAVPRKRSAVGEHEGDA